MITRRRDTRHDARFRAWAILAVPSRRTSPMNELTFAFVGAGGLLAARFGLPLDIARHAIARRFAKKSATVIDANLRAFDRGVTEDEALPRDSKQALAYTSAAPKLLMSGNEASAFAAIHAGC